MPTLQGSGTGPSEPGVRGDSMQDDGVVGFSKATGHAGVAGVNEEGAGSGVFGRSRRADGVFGESAELRGVIGTSKATGHAGVAGVNDDGNGPGVFGRSRRTDGVVGLSDQGNGVHGRGPTGGFFEGGSVAGVHAVAQGTGPAIRAAGDVEVTGDIRLANADCAEDFDIAEAESIEPGTVMVLGEGGVLHQSQQAYDKRVAGVVSGAGGYKPALILDKQQLQSNRKPVALLGKAYCKVDAQYASIEIGDLLTTSPLPGHAMKANDPFKAFGAVIGKALRPLKEGLGLIPILIALQ